MRMAMLVVVLAVGGCFYSPQELRESAKPYNFNSPRDANSLANCLARNAANFSYNVNMAAGEKHGTYQLALRLPSGFGTQTFIVVEPGSPGSRAQIYINPAQLGPEATVRELSKGC